MSDIIRYDNLLEADIEQIKKAEKLLQYEKLGIKQLQDLLNNIEKYKEEFERSYRGFITNNQVRGASYMAQTLVEIEKLRGAIIKTLLDISNREEAHTVGNINITIGVPSKENAIIVEQLDD